MKTVGYKATKPNMTCYNNFKIEIGKTYTIDNDKPLEIGSDSGFHFCQKLEDVFEYYDYSYCRVFEIETESEVLRERYTSITKTITIKREVTKEELIQYSFKRKYLNIFFSNMSDEELLEFKEDEDPLIRQAVANKIIDLDLMFKIFKDDEDLRVRLIVAKKMKDLDLMYNTFKSDKSWRVRQVVVNKMEDLYLMYDTFKDDPDWTIRESVVQRMKDLDLMFNTFKDDEYWTVRLAVVEKMEDLDLMIWTFGDDEDHDVCIAAKRKFKTKKAMA